MKCILLLFVSYLSLTTIGIGVYRVNLTVANYTELKTKYNSSLVAIQAYLGGVVETAYATGTAAMLAGIKRVDLFITPCHLNDCTNPEIIMDKIEDELNPLNYSIVWISLNSDNYTANMTYNIDFIHRMVEEVEEGGKIAGIKIDPARYASIVGNYTGFSKYPLWYVKYDNNANFNDFVSLGGWVKPSMKSFSIIKWEGNTYVDIFLY